MTYLSNCDSLNSLANLLTNIIERHIDELDIENLTVPEISEDELVENDCKSVE